MSRFNVRVYGLWITGNHICVSKEKIGNFEILKFPGGGLEYGEGTIEALKREWLEELNIEIEVLCHFYTTDFFQPSAFDNSQILSIYYLVKPINSLLLPIENENGLFYLEPICTILLNKLSLPIDKHVALLLIK